MLDTQNFKRWMDSAESRAAFAKRFCLLHDEDPEKYTSLVKRMISGVRTLNTQTKQLADELNGMLVDDLPPEKMRLHDELNMRAYKAGLLIDSIRDALSEHEGSGRAWAYIRINRDKVLGTVKNLGRLRNLMNDVDRFSDCTEIGDWLREELEIFVCDDCEDWEYDAKSCETYSDEVICRECAENNYRWSSYYDRYVHCNNACDALDRDGNEVVVDENDDDFNWDDDEDQRVHYDYAPTPKILGGYHASKGKQHPIHDDWSSSRQRWLGVELECEVRRDDITREEKAEQLNNLINQGQIGKRVFFETDGSLNYGLEIISQPMSVPMHRDFWGWLNDKDAVRYMRSHNTTTCGLHVHVSRAPLTQDQIAKMVLFVNDRSNEQLIKAIARRYAEGYCRIKEKSLENAAYSSDRYEAINITSDKTIEFRIFKGSLKYESVMAAIEFASALTDFTADTKVGIADLTTENFMEFINGSADCVNLVPYINNRLELA